VLTFSTTVSDADLLYAIRQWNDALAHQDIATAFDMTYHRPEDSWTPTLLAQAASSYDDGAGDDTLAQITPWDTAVVADLHPRHEVTWFEQPNQRRSPAVVGYVWVDLAYRGRWSDVTAIFNILKIDTQLVLELESIHVM
jgi:hypothetical protein